MLHSGVELTVVGITMAEVHAGEMTRGGVNLALYSNCLPPYETKLSLWRVTPCVPVTSY